jgi:uncharacterized protein YndB with AHSA1/START domain
MRAVETVIGINISPKLFIDAFIDQHQLAEWWGVERALIEPRSGGMYGLAWNISDQGFGYISSGIIHEYEQSCRLRINNLMYFNPEKSILGPMSLIVEAHKRGSFSECYIQQSGYQTGQDWEWYYEAVKSAWPALALVLKDYLES